MQERLLHKFGYWGVYKSLYWRFFVGCSLICLTTLSSLQAQSSENPYAITYKFGLSDYNTLDPIFQAANDPDRILHPDDMNYFGEIGVHRYINSSLNIGIPLRIGSMDSHHIRFDEQDTLCQPCEDRIRSEFFFGGDLLAYYKFNNGYLLKEDFFVAPYIFAGVGALYMSKRAGGVDIQIPMGVGINFKLDNLLYIQAQMEYRKSLLIQKDNLVLSLGILWTINLNQ